MSKPCHSFDSCACMLFTRSLTDPIDPWSYSGDEREPGLISFLHSKEATIRNKPDAVLDAIWEYKQQVGHLMIVGKSKGEGIEKLIAERKPKVSRRHQYFSL